MFIYVYITLNFQESKSDLLDLGQSSDLFNSQNIYSKK